jgi:hypothetical protein
VAVVKDGDEGDRCDREQEEVEESFRDQDDQASCSSDALLAAELHQMDISKLGGFWRGISAHLCQISAHLCPRIAYKCALTS